MSQQTNPSTPLTREEAAGGSPTVADNRGRLERQSKASPGFYRRAWRKLRQDKLALASMGLMIIMLVFSFGAPIVSMLTGHSFAQGNLRNALLMPGEHPEYLLGTDANGRDMLTRLAYGGRISMTVATLAAGIALTIGATVGAVAGFFGGAIDNILMRLVDVVISIPTIALLLLISVWWSPGAFGLAFIIAIVGWTGVSRLVRGEVLTVKNRDYVDAARVVGASDFWILTRHIFPNIFSIIIVWVSLALPGLILTEAYVSYLGFGVPIPIPSWGNMLDEARAYYTQSWTFSFLPGFMIFLTALSINLFGSGLRDALDPRLGD